MFPKFPQQASALPTAGFQVFINVTKRYTSGLQQLAELNVQTVKTVFEESSSVLKAGSSANPADFLSWQSTLFAEFPEKAAAYTRHFLTIVRSTETDILNETRGQFAQFGPGLKSMFDTAAQEGQSAAANAGALLTDATSAAADTAEETTNVVLDASGEIAQTSIDAGAEVTDTVQQSAEAPVRASKANSKR